MTRNLTNTDVVWTRPGSIAEGVWGRRVEIAPWPEAGSHKGWSSVGACICKGQELPFHERVILLAMIAYSLSAIDGFSAVEIAKALEPLDEWKEACRIWNSVFVM